MIDYELESLFEQDSVNKQLVIELSGGTTLTNADIVSESLKLQESICSEQNLTFGSCEASVISFQTVCLEDLVGQTMNVSIILNGNTEKPFVLGEYKVASCKLSDDRKRRNVTAYDKIYDFINRDVIEWYNQLFPTAETTKTVKQVRDSFFNYIGIEQETTTLVNDTIIISKTISADTLSGRDVIKCILEMNGCFGHIGRDGKFHYITISIDKMIYPDYDLFPDYDTFPSGQSMEFMQNTYKTIRFEEYNVKSIDCVAMREQSTGEPTIVGNPGNAYYIEDNFLLYGKNSTELTTIGENILPLMSGIAYTPLALTKRANPCCEVGDNIGVTLVGGQHLTTIVMKREISGIQAMYDVLGATGDEELPQIKSSVQTEITQLKTRQSRIETSVDGITVDISAIERDIDSIEDEQSTMQTRIDANTQGITTKVSKDSIISEINQSAEQISITADKLNLNGAITANGNFKVATDGSVTCKGKNFLVDVSNADFLYSAVNIKSPTGGEYTHGSGTGVCKDVNVQLGAGQLDLFWRQTGIPSMPNVDNIHQYTVIHPNYLFMSSDDKNTSVYTFGYMTSNYFDFRNMDGFVKTWTQLSDKRLKENIKGLSANDTLDFVYKLKPCSYKLTLDKEDISHHGLIAQDVKELMGDNEWGLYKPPVDSYIGDKVIEGYAGLNYTELIPDLVVVVQEQHKEIEELKATISDLAERISKLENKEDK
jgi:hypothetical protein